MSDYQRKMAHSRKLVRQPHQFHQDTQRLTRLLEQERDKTMEKSHKVSELTRELNYIKSQLKRQRSLTEMYINREKEAKWELERVQSTLMTNKRKRPQSDYEELHEAYKVQKTDLQKERQKNKALQEEMDQFRASKGEACSRYHAEVLKVKMENHALQDELDKQLKSHANRISKDLETVNLLSAKCADLHQRFAEEKQGEKNCVGLPRKVKKCKLLLNHEEFLNSDLSRQETAECWYPPKNKRKRLQQTEELNLQSIQQQSPEPQEQESISSMLQCDEQQKQQAFSVLHNDHEALEDSEDSGTEKKDRRSLWKRARHYPDF